MSGKPTHNWGVSDARSSNSAFVISSIQIAESRLGAAINNCINALLSDDHFEPHQIAPLISRRIYPLAFQVIAWAGGLGATQIAAMTDPIRGRLQVFRVAVAFHVISAKRGPEPFGLNELRLIPTEASKCVQAACGLIEWKSASRRVRAVFVLRELIGMARS